MKALISIIFSATLLISVFIVSSQTQAQNEKSVNVQLGPRPFYLLDQLQDGALKRRLNQCSANTFYPSDFSIGHRGAPLQFPEHTRESYLAAAQMGAGIIECDVTFTKDKQLVCRHSQCDLHRTTNILTKPQLAAKCSEPFQPADSENPATARCCTSDITLQEFLSLQGKMDGANPRAKTVEDYISGTANWQTDLYAATGTVITFADSIDLLSSLGIKLIPELKAPEVTMPFNGFSQADYASAVVTLLESKNVKPKDVFLQSFSWPDIAYWLAKHPAFGQQAVFLDDRVDQAENYDAAVASLPDLKNKGLSIIAPPLWALLTTDESNNIVPSAYALAAKDAGLDIITWTLERSGYITQKEDYYYESFESAITSEGDIYRVLEVLHKEIGVKGVFSDWPAAVTYYANCMGL